MLELQFNNLEIAKRKIWLPITFLQHFIGSGLRNMLKLLKYRRDNVFWGAYLKA